MEIIYCRCNWGIPGIEELPPHVHYRHTKLAYCSGGCREKVFWTIQPVLPHEGLRVLEEYEEIRIIVNWKALAKELGEFIDLMNIAIDSLI